MTEPKSRYEIKATEQMTAELYAVFFHEGSAWEEPVLFMAQIALWQEVVVGGKTYATDPIEISSSISDARTMTPDFMRPGFVGLRPLAMPREQFGKQRFDNDIARGRYLADVKDDWSVGADDDT